jgi:glycosyltransferase involved in cell wall biosynthesis
MSREGLKRVCVVGPGFRFLSGLSVYTWSLTNALQHDFDVSVVLLRRLLPRRLYPGASRVGHSLTSLDYDGLRHYDGIDWFWGLTLPRALRFVRRQRPDALVLQWWTAAVGHTYIVLALLARLLRIPVLLEIHEVQDPGEAGSEVVKRYGAFVLRRLLALSSGVVLHHEHDEELLRAEGFDLSSARIAVAPLGPLSHLADVVPVVPAELAGDPLSAELPAARNVLFFGLIRPYKGLEDLVAAFSALPRDVASDLVLTVVGETWEGCTEPLERLAASPHRDRARVVNRYVTDAEAASVFAEADLLVLPYRRASSSGPLHIAMALGLPVLMYDLPSLRAVAEDYSALHVARPGDVESLTESLLAWAAASGGAGTPVGDWQQTVRAYRDLLTAG